MSWLRSALNRAAEAAGAGGKSLGPNFGRVRNYAGAVVQNAGNAVAGGAKIVIERASGKHYNNFRHAVRRLDEVSLNARGEERVQALARWLGALKDLDRDAAVNGGGKVEGQDEVSPKQKSSGEEDGQSGSPHSSRVAQVLFYDPEISSEPLTFRDVFLRSNALENISTSLILQAPEEEELNMVLEMFRLCLAGGPELHNALLSGIQDLSKANAGYSGLLMNRDQLLRMVADAITGLKVGAEVERLDAESARLEAAITEKLSSVDIEEPPAVVASSESEGPDPGTYAPLPPRLVEGAAATGELLVMAAQLLDAVSKKASLLQQGDTEEVRNMKIEKLKSAAADLSEGAKAHTTKIDESRAQKADAVAYRVTKAQEVADAEKAISSEMQGLQKRREELEAELSQVMQAIAAATKKHIHIQEEKEQFDEASSNIVAHLSTQEEELVRSMGQHQTEAETVATWRNFLEDTWNLQASCITPKEEEAKRAVTRSESQYWKLAVSHLQYRQEEVTALLRNMKCDIKELEALDAKETDVEGESGNSSDAAAAADVTPERKKVEWRFIQAESQVKRALTAVASRRPGLESALTEAKTGDHAKEAAKAEELLAALSACGGEFEALPRPKLAIERPSTRAVRKGQKSSESWGRPGTVSSLPREHSPGGTDPSDVAGPPPPASAQEPSAKGGGLAAEGAAGDVSAEGEGEGGEATADGWELDDGEEVEAAKA